MSATAQTYRSAGIVDVSVDDASQIDHALNNAVETVKAAAIGHRTGIMITRIGPGPYILRAHPEVPFGLIRQQHN
ncbi:hypothetical protein [Arthrobacter sp. Alg241-R88]|uniref:hypothetical protein n=1 Tax=Arthrobacter sp. Alg241-R88 TaxID=2305984 RepID=UPI0013D6088A|nr:hypothetical protein [Arthrobacter sp. Alg241-R88]